jgi:hypothetical protein
MNVHAILLEPARTDFFAEPGTMQHIIGPDGAFWGFALACPRCGVLTSLRIVDKYARWGWRILCGDVDQPETLSLEQPLTCLACGWHGLLRRGEFLELGNSNASAACGEAPAACGEIPTACGEAPTNRRHPCPT